MELNDFITNIEDLAEDCKEFEDRDNIIEILETKSEYLVDALDEEDEDAIGFYIADILTQLILLNRIEEQLDIYRLNFINKQDVDKKEELSDNFVMNIRNSVYKIDKERRLSEDNLDNVLFDLNEIIKYYNINLEYELDEVYSEIEEELC